MKKRLIPSIILIAYIALLIKVMVFKDIPTIHVGQLMLNFGGTDGGHPANFMPFATIGPYLLGYKGWIIAGINLIGNIILLVPVGFLIPCIYRKVTWRKVLLLAIASGLVIETMQTVLHVGIFDIDDVILNALGVMIGYWKFLILITWIREKKYTRIAVVTIVIILVALAGLYFIYPKNQVIDPNVGPGVNLCGDTNGTGEITSLGANSIGMKLNNNKIQTIHFTNTTTIKSPAGLIPASDLKIGERATLVGGPNSDGSFTADAVLVCR